MGMRALADMSTSGCSVRGHALYIPQMPNVTAKIGQSISQANRSATIAWIFWLHTGPFSYDEPKLVNNIKLMYILQSLLKA